MADLKPIEQAAYAVLHQYEHGIDPADLNANCRGCTETARAVASSVLNAAADRMLQHSQDAKDHDATEDSVYTFMVAADRLRAWAGGEDRG